MDVANIIPSASGVSSRSAGERSYQYSPHILYSPHIFYPGGILSGFYPTLAGQQPTILQQLQEHLTDQDIQHILPIMDNEDIHP